jgi:ribonuclease BN (tRNA processing enzyme)
LILDLGTGLRSLGNYLNVSLQAAGIPLEANVFLTHLHYDHVLGLPFFSPMRDPGAVLEIYGPSQEGQEGESLHDAMAGMVKPPFFPIHMADFRGELRFHDLGDGDDVTLGSIKVKVRAVPHIGHTLGFRVEADGRSVDLCDGADVVIHDAQYTEDEFVLFSDWGHSTPAYAVHVASVAGARKLHLFHHDPAHVDKEIDQILRQSRRMASKLPLSEVIASAEGMSFDLGAE